MQLPDTLRAAIDCLMTGKSTQDLARHYQVISERYRRESAASSFQIESENEALAYTAARLPATYAAVAHACTQTSLALPNFSPATLLDIGAGPGTATLAGLQTWPESLTTATLLEPNTYLRSISEHLVASTGLSPAYQAQPLAAAELDSVHDLVLASYVLNEIPDIQIEDQMERIWNVTGQTLILIEPGTPLGFSIILRARQKLLELGANIAAPCPHHHVCPLAGKERWCHMSARIERSALHKKVKGDSVLGYEDEKFSYLVASRTPSHSPKSRLLGHPHGQKVIELELCNDDGSFTSETISKRDQRYKSSRKARWGDGI